MIEGVAEKVCHRHVDDRGFFMELVRQDENLLEHFSQLSMSVSYPGVIKAFHYHKEQDDIWFFPQGNAQVVLYDLRQNSPTYQETNVFYMGETNPIVLLIPKGVAHGYRVLGLTPATIVYLTSKVYNSNTPDEYRIPWNDERIGFDWSTKNR